MSNCCCHHHEAHEEEKTCGCGGESCCAEGEFKQAPVVGCRRVGPDFKGEKATVYFTARSMPSI